MNKDSLAYGTLYGVVGLLAGWVLGTIFTKIGVFTDVVPWDAVLAFLGTLVGIVSAADIE